MKNIALALSVALGLICGAQIDATAEGSAGSQSQISTSTQLSSSHSKTRGQVMQEYLHAVKCGDVTTNDALYPLTRRDLHPEWFQSPDCRTAGK